MLTVIHGPLLYKCHHRVTISLHDVIDNIDYPVRIHQDTLPTDTAQRVQLIRSTKYILQSRPVT